MKTLTIVLLIFFVSCQPSSPPVFPANPDDIIEDIEEGDYEYRRRRRRSGGGGGSRFSGSDSDTEDDTTPEDDITPEDNDIDCNDDLMAQLLGVSGYIQNDQYDQASDLSERCFTRE